MNNNKGKVAMYSLIGVNGNAFSIVSYVSEVMRKSHMTRKEIEIYQNEALSSTYEYLLSVSMDMIDSLNQSQE